MKKQISIGLASALMGGFASADSLYYVGEEARESIPLKWVLGLDATYDDNVYPNTSGGKESGFSLNPYVGLSVVNITPQTTWTVYARLGLIYYLDKPDLDSGSDASDEDLYAQARLGADITHRFNERLRFASRNSIAYELEPDYSTGISSSRQNSEYFYFQTDNSIGYRWSERVATYHGIQLTGLEYDEGDVPSNDRFLWTLYTQFRYQLSPQTVLTGDYRYTNTSAKGFASDSSDHFLLGGVEHRFSPNSIIIARAGAQFRDVDDGDSSTNPFVELAVQTRVNEAFSVRGFLRYGVESYDTVQQVEDNRETYDFSERQTLRIGVSAEYIISPMFSVLGGIDYIPASFDQGNNISEASTGDQEIDGLDEDLINVYVGLNVKFTDYLSGHLTYNFTDSSSDFVNREYTRNRITVGVRAEF